MTKKKKKKKSAKKKPVEQKPPKVTPYPTAGPQVKGFEQKLDEQLAGDDKPKRGRPPKQPEPEPIIVPEEIIEQAVEVPFDLWAISQGIKGLELDAREVKTLAAPVKVLLDYYAPNFPVVVIAWASLAITTYAVMKPRLEMIAAIKKQKANSSVSMSPADKAGEARGSFSPQEQGGSHPQNPPVGQGGIVEFPTQTKPQKL